MRIKPPSRHLKSLCRQLGPEYKITVIDLEYVINRDFGNGYDIEVSGVNTSRMNASATIYLWKDKRRIIKIVDGVPQQDIGKWSEWLREKAQSITPEDYDSDGFLKEPRSLSLLKSLNSMQWRQPDGFSAKSMYLPTVSLQNVPMAL